MFFLLLACSNPKTSYVERYAEQPDKTLVEITAKTDVAEQESILLEILSKYPQDVDRICTKLQSATAKEHCERYRTRPHLWSISTVETAPSWSGGFFSERVMFPPVPRKKILPLNPSCTNVISCAQQEAVLAAKGGNVENALGLCAALEEGRSKWDCMFTASEFIPPPDYSSAVRLCLEAGPYAPECHNHLLLKMATWGWIDFRKHQKNLEQIFSKWSDPLYNQQLEDVYWSMVAARVAGVTQPFAMEDFEEYPTQFAPHLRSAIALRSIFAQDPISLAEKVQTVEHLQLTKAHGPNSPIFQPRSVWKVNPKYKWIYFCDIRGGVRPTSDETVCTPLS